MKINFKFKKKVEFFEGDIVTLDWEKLDKDMDCIHKYNLSGMRNSKFVVKGPSTYKGMSSIYTTRYGHFSHWALPKEYLIHCNEDKN